MNRIITTKNIYSMDFFVYNFYELKRDVNLALELEYILIFILIEPRDHIKCINK